MLLKLASVFVVFLFAFLLVPGAVLGAQTYDLNSSANYNLKFTAGSSNRLGDGGVKTADLDNDGNQDLIIAASGASNNSRSSSGSVYILYYSLYSTKSGTVDLTNSANYNIRFDGAAASHYFGLYSFTADLDNDGASDLLIDAPFAGYNSRSSSGSLYVIYNSLFSSLTGTGNNIDLATPSNYNLRFDGTAGTNYFGTNITVADLNNDGALDILSGASWASNNSRAYSGSVYLIYNSIFNSLTGTGNNIDMATASNYSFRLDGAAALDQLSSSMGSADVDGDNLADIIVGALSDNNSRSNSSSVYIIYNTLINSYSSQNIDLNTASNYNLRFDGPTSTGTLLSFAVSDVNGDNSPDLLLGAYFADNNSRTDSGSLYLIYHSIIASYSGTGNNIDTATSSNFSVRFDGAAGNYFAGLKSIDAFDFNGNGEKDIAVVANGTDYNSRADSGSLYLIYNPIFSSQAAGTTLDMSDSANYSLRYDGGSASELVSTSTTYTDLDNNGKRDMIVAARNANSSAGLVYLIYNFPHTISLTRVGRDQITGTVSASNSVTAISGVQYSINDHSPSSSSWKNCSGTTSFTCTLTSLPAGSNSTVYIRAYDANRSYTASVSYATATLNDGTGSGSSSNLNLRANWAKEISFGPNFVGEVKMLTDSTTQTGVMLDKTTHHDDLNVSVSKPSLGNLPVLPWAQGLNSTSEVVNISAVSAFNGYPIAKTDKPFTIQLSFDPKKVLETNTPIPSLKIARYDTTSKTWVLLTNPVVISKDSFSLATTTTDFGYYTVVTPQTKLEILSAPVLGEKEEAPAPAQKEPKPVSQPPPEPKPEPKPRFCFLWWCW